MNLLIPTAIEYPSSRIGHIILTALHSPSSSSTPLPHSTSAPLLLTSATVPFITFHHLLPYLSPMDPDSYPSIEAITFKHLCLNTPNIRHALHSISPPPSSPSSLTCSVFLLSPLVPNLKSPPTSSSLLASVALLASFIYQPTIHQNTTKSFKDLNTLLDIPCLPPIPSSDVPKPMFVRTSREYECFIEFFSQMPNSARIIVNTFESLESKAFKAILDGLCLPDRRTSPIFCIRPLIASNDHRGGGDGNVHECLTWLDLQLSQSIVFLCFGSSGLFFEEQLKKVAVVLERSWPRFLWVVRSLPTECRSYAIQAINTS